MDVPPRTWRSMSEKAGAHAMSRIRLVLITLAVAASCGVVAARPENAAAERKIVVRKRARRLELYEAGKLVRTFRIGLGLNPVDDKTREGDRCTPEGSFYVTTKNEHSQFHRSLGINYPNLPAAERGKRTGLISQRQFDEIARALRRHGNPPQHTRLGGLILIHGGGSQRDWTWGCVALDNADIDALFPLVSVGTPVRIEH